MSKELLIEIITDRVFEAVLRGNGITIIEKKVFLGGRPGARF